MASIIAITNIGSIKDNATPKQNAQTVSPIALCPLAIIKALLYARLTISICRMFRFVPVMLKIN